LEVHHGRAGRSVRRWYASKLMRSIRRAMDRGASVDYRRWLWERVMKHATILRLISVFATLVLTLANLAPALAATPRAAFPADPPDSRFFAQSGFRIDNDKFFDYFQKRGGINNFGFPVSRTFRFMGKTVQFFQRRVLQ